ncbi:hypothetical protein C8R44DRAFT_867215 [Mycena epipterygia]|nr:hypothetical protein C8R44DRAFT_867215 [Mycena epipterygia]
MASSAPTQPPANVAAAPPTAFISGPLAPTPTYFAEHYAPPLDAAIAQGHMFVMGPSAGIDTLGLAYLEQRGVPPAHITVFLSQRERAFADALRARGVAVVVAGRGHTERDAAMTAASDYDILRYQTEAECRALYGAKYRPRVSGTQLNEIRRREAAADQTSKSQTKYPNHPVPNTRPTPPRMVSGASPATVPTPRRGPSSGVISIPHRSPQNQYQTPEASRPKYQKHSSRSSPSQLRAPVPAAPATAFISGPLGPTPTYFSEHYAPRVDAAIAQGHAFVTGTARGIDTLALAYLEQHGVPPARISVFLSQLEGAQPRGRAFADALRARGITVVVAGRGHTERDAAMTAASDYDVLQYHTEAECRALYGEKYRPRVSGTQLNEIRRRELGAAQKTPG